MDSETIPNLAHLLILAMGIIVMGLLFTWNLHQVNKRWERIHQLLLDSKDKDTGRLLKIINILLEHLLTDVRPDKREIALAVLRELKEIEGKKDNEK